MSTEELAGVRLPGPRPEPQPLRIMVELRLTPREEEALALLAEGLGNKEIAKKLKISGHGAKRLVHVLMSKFDARSRTEAVMKAIRLGLIDPMEGENAKKT